MPHLLLATAPSHLILTVLVQLIVILLAARLFGGIAQQLKQPAVVGEVIGGILLGPSLFKAIAPELWGSIFTPEAVPVFNVLKELGLVLLLFLVGMEFEFSHLRHMGKASLVIAVAGLIVPFLLGIVLALVLFGAMSMSVDGEPVPFWHFALFMGTALSITALPVLGRIMMELNITRTRLGVATIAAAAGEDACAWIILATVAGVVRAGRAGQPFDFWLTLQMVGLTLAFILFMLAVVRPLLGKLVRWYFRRTGGELEVTGLAMLLCLLFLCAMATEWIGIFAVFGAFILGAALAQEQQLYNAVSKQMKTFVIAFFLPIFFTFSGLRTNIGGLDTWLQWGFFALVMLAAVGGKVGGCYVAARWTGFGRREAGCIAAMMNTRGLMELIVANVGLDLKVITPEVFTMLVLMSVITNIMTTPILLRLYQGTELEPYIDATAFGSKGTVSPHGTATRMTASRNQ